MGGLRGWERLDEWQERAPPPPPGNDPVGADEARGRLAALLGEDAEPRPQQADYAAAVAAAFAPRQRPDEPQAVLAEAGTGVGKTLGYIAPASLWAERNQGSVTISTYTRNLQSQTAGELDRLYPDPVQKRRRVVIRKGRENFLCLLNYEEAVRAALGRASPGAASLALIARWIGATAAGDLVAGDFPGWLAELIGRGRINALADRRGECIHAACPHFRRCFVEKNVRAARHARLVVANHALVMAQAALGGLDDASVPTRYVFDEGHHLLEAADAAFSVRLSGQEGRELRRWLLGAETGRSRARGLQRRIGDLVEADEEASAALLETLVAARVLPADGWHQRVGEGRGLPGAESFLALVRQQVMARALGDSPYGIEAEARPPIDGLVEAGVRLAAGFDRLAGALRRLSAALRRPLEDAENPPEPGMRQRLEAAGRAAEAATGLRHLPRSPEGARIASPFDYAAQTRIFIVTDIPRDDIGQIAAGFASLMSAAKGGALGLFTAIARLRAVHEKIAPVLEARGLLLLAQHVDAMSTATLVDIFRAEEDSCLLGTDAVRDGVDVPGRSLRLIVFDRVPWPRPDILHRARKPVFGGAAYDDRIARLRLRQAYGRLVRRADDRGIFVILDRALPSRLLPAFPAGVPIARVPLVDAVAATAAFLQEPA